MFPVPRFPLYKGSASGLLLVVASFRINASCVSVAGCVASASWDYAILGDDIVIADQGVAEEYQKIMKDAEVTISKEKSLISFTGAMEFAKRFITDWGTQDFSPVSFKVLNLTGGFVPAFIFQVLRVSLQTSYRLRGGSYRVYTNRAKVSSMVATLVTGALA